MTGALLVRTSSSLEELASFAELNEAVLAAYSALDKKQSAETALPIGIPAAAKPPTSTQVRQLNHSLVYTRSYALFENFVFELLGSYLDLLDQQRRFQDLDDSMRGSFRQGTATVLNKLEHERYDHLSEEGLVKNHWLALQGDLAYKLLPEVMLICERNYRLNEINYLCLACGIKEAKDWIISHYKMKRFFSEEERETGTADSFLRSLVKFRNQASHGRLSDISDIRILKDVIQFIDVLCRVIFEKVSLQYLALTELPERRSEGIVTETFQSGRVAVVEFVHGLGFPKALEVGSRLLCLDGKGVRYLIVNSLQFYGVDILRVHPAEGVEVGIGLSAPVKPLSVLIPVTREFPFFLES